jgi:hypothetical protein
MAGVIARGMPLIGSLPQDAKTTPVRIGRISGLAGWACLASFGAARRRKHRGTGLHSIGWPEGEAAWADAFYSPLFASSKKGKGLDGAVVRLSSVVV